MIQKTVVSLLLVLMAQTATAQWKWWNEVNNWDGCTNWYYYLKMTPRYMGPNALPVPAVTQGSLSRSIALETSTAFHFSRGDNTQDLAGRLYWPVAGGKAALEVKGVALEHYHMDSATRDDRAARDYDGEGFASGDVHINTYVQILQDVENWPDLLLRINLRAPSGNRADAARYTDTPGYAFDLSTGKTFRFNTHTSLRINAMAGVYFWQTNLLHQQNDAVLYGTSIFLKHKELKIQTALAGYHGYMNNGDRPVVARGEISHALSRNASLKLKLQHGLHDLLYTTVGFSGTFYFSKASPSAKKSAE